MHHVAPFVHAAARHQRRRTLVQRSPMLFNGLQDFIANLHALTRAKSAWGALSPLHVLCANGNESPLSLRRLVASVSFCYLPLHFVRILLTI